MVVLAVESHLRLSFVFTGSYLALIASHQPRKHERIPPLPPHSIPSESGSNPKSVLCSIHTPQTPSRDGLSLVGISATSALPHMIENDTQTEWITFALRTLLTPRLNSS